MLGSNKTREAGTFDAPLCVPVKEYGGVTHSQTAKKNSIQPF